MISEPGRYLVFRDRQLQIFPLERGWTRIGRSVTADIRLDDPTRLAPPRADRLRGLRSRCGSSTTAASTDSSSTARRSTGAG